MVTTTREQAGTPSQPTQPQPVDDFRSLLAAVPPAKADALKERIYDWLEKREKDAETAVEKAKARAAIVEEQNRIVRMELQDVENNRLRENDAAAARKARAGLFAEAMSALNAPEAGAPLEEEHDDPGVLPTDYQQPTDSSATTHPLQPLGANVGRKVHAGDISALDIVIKELLDEVMQLREGASANVARILILEDQLQSTTDALATHSALLDEKYIAPRENYDEAWGPLPSNTQTTSQSFSFNTSQPVSFNTPFRSWGEEKERESDKESDAWMRDDVPSLRSWSTRRTLRDPEPAPIRGYLDDDSDGPHNNFDACFKRYADMMLLLQLKANGERIAFHDIPWPVLPYTPDDAYPVPRWRARYAEKQDVDKFVDGFLASKHADVTRVSMRDDWLDLLEYKHDDTIKEIVEKMLGLLN